MTITAMTIAATGTRVRPHTTTTGTIAIGTTAIGIMIATIVAKILCPGKNDALSPKSPDEFTGVTTADQSLPLPDYNFF